LGVLPISIDGNSLTLIPKDPFNFSVIDELGFELGLDIEVLVTDPDLVEDILDEVYGQEQSYEDFLSEIDADSISDMEEGASASELAAMANEGPVVRFVNLVLTQAVRDKASDIHFEPFEDEFK
ncbi:MAG: pilus assembly protein PilB, partial [Opitutae bacterium]